jgi:hypothetical protein
MVKKSAKDLKNGEGLTEEEEGEARAFEASIRETMRKQGLPIGHLEFRLFTPSLILNILMICISSKCSTARGSPPTLL